MTVQFTPRTELFQYSLNIFYFNIYHVHTDLIYMLSRIRIEACTYLVLLLQIPASALKNCLSSVIRTCVVHSDNS